MMKRFMQSTMAACLLTASFSATAAKKNTFQAVTSQLDQNGDYFNYSSFNVQNISDKVMTWIAKITELEAKGKEKAQIQDALNLVDLLLKDSGAFDIQAIGQSSVDKGDHYLNKSLIYASSTEGSLFQLLGGESHELKALNFLPKQTVLATASDVNLEVFWQTITKIAAKSKNPQVQMGIGMAPGILTAQGVDLNKLLGSLDKEVGLFVCADESKMTPYPIDGKMVSLPKLDATVFLKTKTSYLSEVLSQKLPLAQFKKETVDAYTVYEIPAPMPMIAPAVAISKDYIFVSSDKARLLESLQNFKDQKGLVSTEAFATLSKGVPSRGNGFSYFAPKTIDMFLKPFESEMKEDQKEAISFVKGLFGDDIYFYGVNQVNKDGIMSINNFTLRQDALSSGGYQYVAMMGTMSAMILPNLAKARAKSLQLKRKANMKQAGVNVDIYRVDSPNAKVYPEEKIFFEGIEAYANEISYVAKGQALDQEGLIVVAVESLSLIDQYAKSVFVLLSDGRVLPVMGRYSSVEEVLAAAKVQLGTK